MFVKPQYTAILDASLNHCILNKGLRVHAYVYVTSHLHLIVTSTDVPIESIVRDFKRHTSKEIVKAIQEYPESRRKWLLNKMSFAADRLKRNSNYKVWQDGFHPIILDTPQKLEQRLKYIHDNPTELQLVDDPLHWINSSILSYTDERHQSAIKIDVLLR